MRERLPSLDRRAAKTATAFAVGMAVLVVAAQGAIAALATGGAQPVVGTDRVPQTAAADQWADAPSRTVSLSKQQMAIPYGGGSVDEMTVQAMTNESHVGFRLSWTDPTNDTSLSAPGNYSDAAAVMLRTGERPPITMGAAGKPVNIWYWRASWQYGGHPSEWTSDMYAYPHPDNETKPGLAAGNPLSQGEFDRYAQNYYAKGYGSLSHAPTQNVHATATREGDRWSVAFVRERTGNGTYDAVLTDQTVYLAFAVWNGSADERNGQKSLTMQYSTLDPGGNFSAAQSGSSGGSSGESGGSSDGTESGGAGGGLPQPMGYLGGVLAAVIVSWTIIYWRAAE